MRKTASQVATEVLEKVAISPRISGRLLRYGAPLLGGAALGVGGAVGLQRLGRRDIEIQRRADELQQLLNTYPELLYTTPTAFQEGVY